MLLSPISKKMLAAMQSITHASVVILPNLKTGAMDSKKITALALVRFNLLVHRHPRDYNMAAAISLSTPSNTKSP